MFGRDEKVSALRLTATQYIILAIFLVLAYGLWRLQVMQSGYYSLAAEKNRIRNVPVLAPRGKILDREGRATAPGGSRSFSALLLRDQHFYNDNFHHRNILAADYTSGSQGF